MPKDKAEKSFFDALPNFVRFADDDLPSSGAGGAGGASGGDGAGASGGGGASGGARRGQEAEAHSAGGSRPAAAAAAAAQGKDSRSAAAAAAAAAQGQEEQAPGPSRKAGKRGEQLSAHGVTDGRKKTPKKNEADGNTPTAAKKALKKQNEVDANTLSKIEKLARQTLAEATKGKNPAVDIRTRTLSNVSFNEKKQIIELGDRTQSREFFNTGMVRKFMQTMLVASECKNLIDEGKTMSIRQMFYLTKHTLQGSSENTFEDQNESDPIIEDLEVGIDALREELHLFATRKGSVVGKMVIDDSGDRIDLARMGRGGWSIPSIWSPRSSSSWTARPSTFCSSRKKPSSPSQRGRLLEEAQLHPDDQHGAGDARRATPPPAHLAGAEDPDLRAGR